MIQTDDTLAPLDIAEHLRTPEETAAFLEAVLELEDYGSLLRALGHVARAQGMSLVAEKAGLGRESLYKSLAPDARPRLETIAKVMKALGFSLSVTAISPSPGSR
jgi:probable addiction module antidote protein